MHVGLNVSLGDNSLRREKIFLFLKENESFFFKKLKFGSSFISCQVSFKSYYRNSAKSLRNNLKMPNSGKNIPIVGLMSVTYWPRAGLPGNKDNAADVGLEVLCLILV